MLLFARQVGTLIYKNFLVAAVRRPISTTFRALILPLIIVLVLSYAQNFLNPPQKFGVGEANPIKSLENVITKAASSRNTIVFVDSGLTKGDVSTVIQDVAKPFHDAGRKVVTIHNATAVQDVCRTSRRGTSNCFAAVIIHSSITQPKKGGIWNYTLRADPLLGGTTNVDSQYNDPQVYLLPLQKSIDTAIAKYSPNGKPEALATIDQYPWTLETEQHREESTRNSYLVSGIAYFGVVFFFSMVGVVYQLTGLMASEREQGLSQLIEAMMPNTSRWQPQAARIFAYHGAFSIIYFPSWLAVGIILSALVFTKSNAAIIILYHITIGLALTSYAIVGASFFKKAQVSGITMSVVAVVLAVIPQVLDSTKQTKTTVVALSLIFPSANYTYFLIYLCYWELAPNPTNLNEAAPTSIDALPPWTVHGTSLWCFLILQIIAYPLLGALIEKILFGTQSSARSLNLNSAKSGPTVHLGGFSKTYKQNVLLRLLWKKKADVHAVQNLTLDARKGQILTLLGPNGSGKSTTLDAIAGLNKISNGSIDIDGRGGLGIAPQKNVLWDDLTVEEHVHIFYKLKTAQTQHSKSDLTSLVDACDLRQKAKARSKTLSGGQKRKLQLAMMFAGGSAVCCVDEVSSGLDPLSRRKIWDILLAERGDRTIIMTTHFLDEADFLADHIVILSKGNLMAEGSSAGLKSQFGDGYSIHVPKGNRRISAIGGYEPCQTVNGATYTVPDANIAGRVISALEKNGIENHKVSGATLEDIFLKLTGTYIHSSPGPSEIEMVEKPVQMSSTINLHNGRHIGPWKQIMTLFHKRWVILGRNFMPYVGAMIVSLIGAGVIPLFLKHFGGTTCEPRKSDATVYSYNARPSTFASFSGENMIAGPPDSLSQKTIDSLARIYSTKDSSPDSSYSYLGFTDPTEVENVFIPTTNLNDLRGRFTPDTKDFYGPGGFWLGNGSSDPTIAWLAFQTDFPQPLVTLNVLDNFLTNVPIVTGYLAFDIPPAPKTYDFVALLAAIYFSLVFCMYPAFFAIYPTVERLRHVRALHYSNGVRSMPLWLAYLCFDFVSVLLISLISTILLAVSTKIWYHVPYIFLILLLYGLSSTLLAYLVSLVARSGLAAWSLCSSGQAILALAYFGAYLGVQSNMEIAELQTTLNKVHFTIGLISPVANLVRTFFVSLNQFAILCGDRSNPAAIELYGGPILYLFLQIFILFGILLSCESRFSFVALLRRRTSSTNSGEYAALSPDVLEEVTRVKQSQVSGLRVTHLSKTFGKNKAVDDVTFGVEHGEIFALLGPNGAGKSTAISLIRGDIQPSGRNGGILVDEASLDTQRNLARSHLGVCPQFDACDTLTVKHHLLFYARVRGVADPLHNTNEVIRAFRLEQYRDRLAQKLSGGTKRKLSLAIALIGNPSVLLLDEPSTGLDAASKRVMWNTLSQLSSGRSIVLTTHSMEEADALAHRAGIVASRMLTVGTVDDLRHRWGDVYHVQLVTSSAPYTSLGEMEMLKSWLMRNIEGVEIEKKTYCGQIRFTVPATNKARIPGNKGRDNATTATTGRKGIGHLFRLLNDNKSALGIEYYSIGQTTMDEVFVKIVRQHGGKEEGN